MTKSDKEILRTTPCSVCETSERQQVGVRLVICSRCCHEKRVRTYCKNCHSRLDLSLQKAREIFSEAGLNIWRTGVVFQFEVCILCSEEDSIPKPKIFMIQASDSELEFYCAAFA